MSAIIEKVRKLRALSESTNVHEAAAAAAAAERLIQEHNLSEASFVIGDEDEHVTYELVTTFASRVDTWKSNLLFFLGRAYQCSGMYRTLRENGEIITRYVTYGRPQDIETLRYQFAFFTTEIVRLALSHGKGKGRTWTNSFRLGAVQAIGDSLYTVQRETRAAATSSALVVVDRRAELSKERRDKDHPDLKSARTSSSRVDFDGFSAGKRAGAGINQRSAIGAGGTRLLGSGR